MCLIHLNNNNTVTDKEKNHKVYTTLLSDGDIEWEVEMVY